jgi:hypothetical protein
MRANSWQELLEKTGATFEYNTSTGEWSVSGNGWQSPTYRTEDGQFDAQDAARSYLENMRHNKR